MTTKKGIKIIRHMLPDIPIEYNISTNLEWNNMYSFPSDIAVKKQEAALKSLDDILSRIGKNEDHSQKLWDLMWEYYHSKPYKKNHPIITGITA